MLRLTSPEVDLAATLNSTMGTRPLTDAEMDELTLIKAEAEEDARWKAIQKGPYPSRELKESTEVVLLCTSNGSATDRFAVGPH